MKYLTIFFLFVFLFTSSCREREKESKIKQKTGISKKIKKEEKVYNFLDYTEDFSDQTWQRTKAIVQENVMESPENRVSADLLDLSIDKDQSRIAQIVPEMERGIYAFSIYLKALEGESGNHAIAVFSKGENGSFKSVVVPVNYNEWTRAVVKVSQDSYGDIIVYPGNKQIKSSELNKVYIWGAQLEKIETLDETIKAYNGISIIE